MKVYYGNYLGLVVNSSDPEYRGRVQVFVPHIMPAIYEGWNEEGEDIEISCVGSNIPEGLTPEIHARLVKILPWAEAASPIIGSSAPGNLFSDIVSGVKSAAGAAYSAVAGAANHFFNQGPTSNPVTVEGGDAQALIDKAKGITGLSFDGAKWGKCARGTTGLDKAAGLIDNNGPSAGFVSASDLAAGGTNETGYNPYTQGTGAKYFQKPFTVDPSTYQPQVGDSVFCGGGGGEGYGHAQKCVGFDSSGKAVWVSDNPQTHFFTKNKTASYNNFTVYRLNDEGLAKYTTAIGGKITGQEAPSSASSQQTADAAPAAPNNLAKSDGRADAAPQPNLVANPEAGMNGTISGGGTVSNIDTSNMSPAFKAQYDRVLKSMEGSKFDPQTTGKPVIPNDGQTYGITTGSKEEWAHFFTRNASVESSFNPNTAADINGLKKGPLTSFGLYQMGTTQFQRHGGGDIQSPDDNTRAYLKYAEEMYFGNTYRSGGQNVIGGKTSDGKWLGLAAGYGPIRRITSGSPNSNEKQLLAENIANSERQTGNYTGSVAGAAPIAAGSTNIVNNTDSNGRTPVINTNDMASGLFAYPNPGAMVWVFFREGNPLFPVYFAASYSSAEWKSAYRGGSPAEAYTNEGGIIGTGTIMKLGPEGGFLSQNRTNLTDPLDNNSSLSFFHQHGSNITMKDGCDFYFSRNNKRDEVDNDRFVITKGYKEEWIEGDSSTNTRGNLIVKVGNISAEAIAAMQELADMSYDMNQTLMDKPKSSGANSKESTSAAKPEASATTANNSASTSTPTDTNLNTYTNAGRIGSLNYSNAQSQQNAFKDAIKASPVQTVPGASNPSKGAYNLGVDIQKPVTSYASAQPAKPSGVVTLRSTLGR